MIAFLQYLAAYQVGGLPLINITGSLTLVCLLLTVFISSTLRLRLVPIKYHRLMGRLTLVLALLHGAMGLSLSF